MNERGEKNTLLSIDSIWMAVSVDDDGTEGICAVLVGAQWMPLLAADEKRLPYVLEQAEIVAKRDQRRVRIIKLHGREQLAEMDGRQ